MITSPFVVPPSLRLGALLVLAAGLLAAPAPADVLMQDLGDESVAEDTALWNWESFAVTSSNSRISVEAQALKVALAPGDHASFSRAADLTPAPAAILCTFNVSMPGTGADEATAQVFRMGWDFGASNADEPDAHTYGALGLGATPGGSGFQLRDLIGGRTSDAFTGTQAVSWVLNNSGRAMSYAAPNGTVEAVADDRMDVWVGPTRVFDEMLATNPAGRITDLKWYWDRGAGVTAFDHFEIRTLEDAKDSPGSAISNPSAPAIEASPGVHGGQITLGRPMPNPFTQTMRFAYSIPGGSAPVDIGVFDVAGRRIRILAHGTQTTGEYEAIWDGLGDDGAQVRHGMYFLRASVGSERRISRVMYLHE